MLLPLLKTGKPARDDKIEWVWRIPENVQSDLVDRKAGTLSKEAARKVVKLSTQPTESQGSAWQKGTGISEYYRISGRKIA